MEHMGIQELRSVAPMGCTRGSTSHIEGCLSNLHTPILRSTELPIDEDVVESKCLLLAVRLVQDKHPPTICSCHIHGKEWRISLLVPVSDIRPTIVLLKVLMGLYVWWSVHVSYL